MLFRSVSADDSLGTIQVVIKDASGSIVFMSNQFTVFDSSPNPTVIPTTDASGNPINGQTVEIQRTETSMSTCTSSSGFTYACYKPLMLDEVQIIGQ